MTPNQFESELLTGIAIRDEGAALDAVGALHVMGATLVAITPTTVDNANTLVVFASKRAGDQATSLRADVPRIDALLRNGRPIRSHPCRLDDHVEQLARLLRRLSTYKLC